MINIVGVVKHGAEAGVHLMSGNIGEAGASVTKAAIKAIPIVGHIPGSSHLVDAAFSSEPMPPMSGLESRAEVEKAHDILDYDGDGDVDLDDISDMFHHVIDFLSS